MTAHLSCLALRKEFRFVSGQSKVSFTHGFPQESVRKPENTVHRLFVSLFCVTKVKACGWRLGWYCKNESWILQDL